MSTIPLTAPPGHITPTDFRMACTVAAVIVGVLLGALLFNPNHREEI